MSFDRATRNLLANTVGKIRERLKTDVMAELRRLGFQDDGTVLELASIGGLTESERAAAEELRALLDHLIAAEQGADGVGARGRSAREIALAAYDRMAREIGFTTLNRLVALRMSEERGLVVQSVGAGMGSNGFLLYERLVGNALGGRHQTYRAYLECLYDEIGRDLPTLFDRTDPHSRVFPGERCLEDVLALLNAKELTHLWAEDETIGWVYQYYNDPDERKKMRESQAPRTSRELAVRNQFFTPRYVVDFLTDNTLGRTWYEMRQGDTRLAEQCRYMVRRKRPVFLAPGEEPPRPFHASEAHAAGTRIGELWTRPNLELDDVSAIEQYALTFNGYHYVQDHYVQDHLSAAEDTVLAACEAIAERLEAAYRESSKWQGSFEELRVTLYFWQRRFHHWGEIPDQYVPAYRALYQAICRQWDLETEYIPYRAPKDPRDLKILDPACGSGHFLLYAFDLLATIYEEAWEAEDLHALPAWSLRRDYLDRAALRHAIPALTLRYNLHGIDIDPRACQIAALALWLRAQRTYQALGLKGDDRPPISHGNIVCAAPMPGERDHFTRFLAGLDSPTLARLAEAMWDELQLAGVAGSLLKPEEGLRKIVADEHTRYRGQSRGVQQALFLEHLPPIQQVLDFSDVTDELFWDAAEERILDVLRAYGEATEVGDITTRRLFAADGAQGFRFVEVLRKQFDVVLMNPPFGAMCKEWKAPFEKIYPRTKNDLYAAFVERGLLSLRQGGMLGAITSRTGFFLTSFQKWREEILLKEARPIMLADLGTGVLDAAMVETIAYALEKHVVDQNLTCFRVLSDEDKGGILLRSIDALHIGRYTENVLYQALPRLFSQVPGTPFAYWLGPNIRRLFSIFPKAESEGRHFTKGLCTTDDERFLRTHWEVEPSDYGTTGHEFRITKTWASFAKGGAATRYYGDTCLVVNWRCNGAELKAYLDWKIGREGQWSRWINSVDYYFRPGLTWPLRASRFSPQPLASGSIFSVRGYAAFAPHGDLEWLLGLTASSIFDSLFKTLLGRFGFPEFVVGALQQLPMPYVGKADASTLGGLAHRAWAEKRALATVELPSHSFLVPAMIMVPGDTLVERGRQWDLRMEAAEAEVACVQAQIDALAYRIYGLDESDRTSLTTVLSTDPATTIDGEGPDENVEDSNSLRPDDTLALTSHLLAYALGCSVGRWDIRYAAAEKPAPELSDIFAPLPICPPGMLQNAKGLPAVAADVPAEYPLRISWSGILVDDEGHQEDVECRVREAIQVIWNDRADAIEREASTILGVRSLRDYFRRPGSFFDHHLTQYSKSRRQAPIYWPLSTPSGSYTIWFYYHRLGSDTLFTAVNRYVLPKIGAVERDLSELTIRLDTANGREATRLREEVEAVGTFRSELIALRDELLRVAALPYRPNLNDGVIINAAPLHKLFRLPKWAKDTKECWTKLERGDYDWAHMAYTIWPERVREKCSTDKSLAIAHGLEDLYVAPPNAKLTKGRRARVATTQVSIDDSEDEDG